MIASQKSHTHTLRIPSLTEPPMALRAFSLNRSPAALLSLPLSHALASKTMVQILPTLSPPYSPSSQLNFRHDSHLASDDSLTIAAITEAVAPANAAAEAAKDAVSSAMALGKIASMQVRHGEQQQDSRMVGVQEDGIAERRRRRRRKRRKDLEFMHEELGRCFMRECSSRSKRSGYLTARQEAEFSLYLKVGAMIEAIDQEMKGTMEVDPSSSGYNIAAAGIRGRRNRERVMLRAKECKERIILSYKRLVVSIATPYQGHGLSLQDLIQEGCIGLLRGAQRFDCKKGYKLSTYVYWWIKQAILKAIANKSRIVRLPGSMSGTAAKVVEANSFLRKQLQRCPTYVEIAEFLNIDVSKVQILSERSRQPISVDQPMNNGGITLKDIVPGPDEIRPETMVSRQLMLQNMEKMLKILNEREEYIIRLHYGLNGETPRSYEEIGRLLNLSRERVRQIHWAALTRLQDEKSLVESLCQTVV